jgi:hypothetical protein
MDPLLVGQKWRILGDRKKEKMWGFVEILVDKPGKGLVV